MRRALAGRRDDGLLRRGRLRRRPRHHGGRRATTSAPATSPWTPALDAPGDERGIPDERVSARGARRGRVQAGLDTGVVPRALSAPAVVNTETMNLLAIAGLAATSTRTPRRTWPPTCPPASTRPTYRFLFSKDAPAFFKGSPTVKDFRFTNAAVLGGLMDDTVRAARVHAGQRRLLRRRADRGQGVPGAANGGDAQRRRSCSASRTRPFPDEPGGPLYTWRNYDRVGDPTTPATGPPTAPPSRGRQGGHRHRRTGPQPVGAPLDFTEHYFPTKLITDIPLAGAPDADDAVHAGGMTANPTLNVLAGDGLLAGTASRRRRRVRLPAYRRADRVAVQNDGRPEPVSTNLAAFATG